MAGSRVKQGAKLWAVGTWPIKGAFYADVRKLGIQAGQAGDPDGYCHFGMWLDVVYFRQITSEYLADEKIKGRILRRWKIRPSETDNHFFDCRVYNMALAEYLGLSSHTADDWAALARVRGLPDATPDLFTPRSRLTLPEGEAVPEPPPEPAAPEPSPPPAASQGGWFDRPSDDWF